ncbi:MAG TPA: 1,4-alpha-glucan branching protein domain-containing protein [Dermatophilaceae bacterium]|nr:1,4-alpha-glucan branching protein domain-containing protein [Dermatophilaceae bacterium]
MASGPRVWSRHRDAVPGAFALVLHSHLPWLPGHGVWPVGEEWLHQALVESYVPLVEELHLLAAEGHRDVLTLGVTPVLAASLDDPRMVRDAATWCGLWEQRSREVLERGDAHERAVAAYELGLARAGARALRHRWRSGGSPVLRELRDAGVVELLGGPLTHPLLPRLLPEVARALLAAGLEDAVLRTGRRPGGIWSPECAWAPGLGDLVDEAGVGHLVVDEQLVRDAGGHPHAAWRVAGHDVVVVPRDLTVTNLVWSSRSGYPTGGAYRDFHARETARMSGLRLWATTSPDVPTEAKDGYVPARAAALVRGDVAHFVDAVRARLLEVAEVTGAPGLVTTAYDTELFGHWWHEGPRFLGEAVRALRAAGVTVTTLAGALAAGHVAGELDLGEGSWGAAKDFSVWEGPAVADLAREQWWAQRRVVDLVGRERATGRLGVRRPDLDALLGALAHALSSDWAFLVTRGQSADYARGRAEGHLADVHRLAALVDAGDEAGALAEAARQRGVDHAFPHLDARRLGA